MNLRYPDLPRYDVCQSYDWNYEHAPEPIECDVPLIGGEWSFCGIPVASPLGIPAGPLLNSRWLLYYSSLGFDVLTYKTVRSSARSSYPLPNLQPVQCRSMNGSQTDLLACDAMDGSWAISFGMPSKAPTIWRADVEVAKNHLSPGKVLCVSVVGSLQDGWSIEEMANDYGLCAYWAVNSGADVVEVNFSCPNVSTCDGQLYHDYISARLVAQTVRSRIGSTPLVIKIGHVIFDEQAAALVEAVGDYCDGLAMTNCISATVVDANGTAMFGGQPRGIGGAAIQAASLDQVKRFRQIALQRRPVQPALIGVGGVRNTHDVLEYLKAGASSVQIATAAMLQPDIALRMRSTFAATSTMLYPAGLLD